MNIKLLCNVEITGFSFGQSQIESLECDTKEVKADKDTHFDVVCFFVSLIFLY